MQSEKPRSGPSEAPSLQPKHNFAAWSVLAVSLLATGLLWYATQARFQEYDQLQFDREAELLHDRMRGRISRLAQVLKTYAATFKPGRRGGEVAGEPRPVEFPELTHINFVAAGEEASRAGPLEGVWQGDTVLRAARRAPAAGSLQITGRMIEPSPEGTIPGISMVVPVFAPLDAPNRSDERSRKQLGWLTAFLRIPELMQALIDETEAPLALELHEEVEPDRYAFVARNTGHQPQGDGEGHSEARFQTTSSFDLGGRAWMLKFYSTGPLETVAGRNHSLQLLLGGLAVSILLFDIALMVDSKRSEAAAVSELMTRRLRESEARIRAVVDHAPDGIITFDPNGIIATFNPGAEQIFGWTLEEVKGRSVDIIMPGWLPSKPADSAEDLTRGGKQVLGRRKEGAEVPVEATVSQMRFGSRRMYAVIVRDISERKRAEEALRQSEERYSLAAWASNDGLWDWNLLTDEIYYSARWKSMLGFEENEIGFRPAEWLARIHVDDRERFDAVIADHLRGRTPHLEAEYRLRHKDSSYRWMLVKAVAVKGEDDKPIRLAGSQTDITARKKVELQLLRDALYDSLTGLPNRAHFMRVLERVVRENRSEEDQPFALLFLDMDHFKDVNDSLGHHVGDQLLVSIAERLKTALRADETLARLGGDEFAVLIENLHDLRSAASIAERIQKRLATSFVLEDHEVYVTVSIGIALGPNRDETPESLIRDADTAMYRAKAAGKGRHATFDQSMHIQAVERLSLETSLRRAIDREEFLIHYQPFVSLETGRITGCEALVRWQHPTRGMIPPLEFIPIAEDMGLINPLGEWILNKACQQMKSWHEMGLPPIRLAVNISPRQCTNPGLFDVVTRALQNSGLPATSLQLEITESALMESADAIIEPLVELYGKGIQFSLDDFGTGYSSLMYLQRFPITTLKIASSFVREITTDPEDAQLASGLMALGRTLGLNVICEGVETQEQLNFLTGSRQCDEVQGYFMARPIDAEAFRDLVEAESKAGEQSEISRKVRKGSTFIMPVPETDAEG
jgi:diguanylate cyclase (GGDEF)-like protein/PAS domain S-box-containing protein